MLYLYNHVSLENPSDKREYNAHKLLCTYVHYNYTKALNRALAIPNRCGISSILYFVNDT